MNTVSKFGNSKDAEATAQEHIMGKVNLHTSIADSIEHVNMQDAAAVDAYRNSSPKADRPCRTLALTFEKPVEMEWIGELQSDYPIFKQDRWKDAKLVSFESQGGYDPVIFKNLKTDPIQYGGTCHLGDETRDCVFSVGDDGKFFLVVKHGQEGDFYLADTPEDEGDNQLFEEGNKVDSLTIHVRIAAGGVFEEDFIG